MKITRDWVDVYSLAVQGTLLTSVRGPDDVKWGDTAKHLVRALRYTFMNNAHEKGVHDDCFMGDMTGICDRAYVAEFLRSHDHYPHHWMMHFIHAAEIVGYLHPDGTIRAFWHQFYLAMASAFHMEPESRETMLHRLRPRCRGESVGEGATMDARLTRPEGSQATGSATEPSSSTDLISSPEATR